MKHVFLFALVLTACGEPTTPGEAQEITTDAAIAPVQAIAYSLHYGPATIAPGEEAVTCLDVVSPGNDIWFRGFHASTKLMHHVNIWRRTSGTPYKVPTKCDGGGSFGVGIFGVTQTETTEFFDAAPEYKGAAMEIPGGTGLILDLHYLNATDAPEAATVDVDFFAAASHELEVSSYSLNAAKSLVVPAGVTKTLTYSCSPPSEEKVLETTAHVHAHDIGVSLLQNGKEIYHSTDWATPIIQEFDSLHGGDLVLKPTDKLTWSCEIANTTASSLKWANEVQTGEMCIVFGRSIGPKWGCLIP